MARRQVIPREGVERLKTSKLTFFSLHLKLVIPREGVESHLPETEQLPNELIA